MTAPITTDLRIPKKATSAEPIAIIGVGCRFPGGADNADRYWSLLRDGVDAITQTPADRWSLQKYFAPGAAVPGKTQSKWGGYVDGIDQFDPQLFGISPREAASMDPQQRMLLEVAWRSLEDAGQPTEKIAGRSVAVYTGISSFDYAVAGLSDQDRGVISPYSNTGGSSSIAANRISYCFDLRGPSVAVDTACSSSLVAVHLACESLHRGEAELALAGGVNALLLPDFYVAFSQLGVLSPDGRCKTFDARANGYVRSEGAGMVLLKPLRAAVRDGDFIYALIRGTALNQDGRTPGMTVPSQSAQETLVRTACDRAGVDPANIQYVEAHGTGTPVGDPIEASALANVLKTNRPADQPCWIGSVKTNLGHLEAGAGIASLIKVALSLRHKQIPAHLHFQTANPSIDFDRLNLRIPLTTQPWPGDDGNRLAGVNGFGYGGANAHVILQEAPASSPKPIRDAGMSDASTHRLTNGDASHAKPASPILLPISAANQTALNEVATTMARWLENDGANQSLANIASYAAHRRTHHAYRASVSGTTHEQWIEQLNQLDDSKRDGDRLTSSQLSAGVLFVCCGQGPQWWGMGRQLLTSDRVFRETIAACDGEFAKYVSWSLVEELSRPEHESRMQQTSIAQPSIFAIQVALAAAWADRGIHPAAVVGHSVGEIAAAYLSGSLTWQDACCVAVHRGRTMDLASSQGAMIAVGLSADEAATWINEHESNVAIAAVNSPTSITISGDAGTVERLADKFDGAGVFCRRLAVEYAFHSPQMDPVRDPLLESLAHIRPRKSQTPIVSTVTGKVASGTEFDANYWWQNVRQSVRFADAMHAAAQNGFGAVLEIGPHPVLTYSVTECFQHHHRPVRVLSSLHRERGDVECMTHSLAQLYAIGIDPDWDRSHAAPIRHVELPPYPFQRRRYWSESRESVLTRLSDDVHPLLGEPTHHYLSAWQSRIDLKVQDYLAEHRVRDTCMLPAAAMIEMVAAAASRVADKDSFTLEKMRLHHPCLLSADRPQFLETVYHRDRGRLEIAARQVDDSNWQSLATVQVSDHVCTEDWQAELLAVAIEQCRQSFTGDQCYAYCKRLGLDYGRRFRGIVRGSRRRWESVAEVNLSGHLDDTSSAYHVHPAVLDSCFHAMITADAQFDHELGGLYLPVQIDRITFLKSVPNRVTAHVRLISKDDQRMVADIDLVDADGQPCVLLRGFTSQRVQSAAKPETVADLIYRYQWVTDPSQSETTETIPPSTPRHWCVFADGTGLSDQLIESIRHRGDHVTRVDHGNAFRKFDDQTYLLRAENGDDFAALFRDCNHHQTNAPITDIVYLWGLDTPANDGLTVDRLDQSLTLSTTAPMHLVQAWEHTDVANTASLVVITNGAQTVDDRCESVSLAQSPLVGFARVVISESSRVVGKLIDLPGDVSHRGNMTSAAQSLMGELIDRRDGEDEVMYRDGTRRLHRFVQQIDEALPQRTAQRLPSRLEVGRSSGIADLKYRTLATDRLEPNQVEIEVLAAGLNFSDVMKSLDLYPGLPPGPVLMGAECSGRVKRVGSQVTVWQVGDEVVAVAPGSFATAVVVDEALVAKKPSALTHKQAATIPIAFLTAQYALVECARMRSGDDVLIHAASGGVGLAAMQLARLAKARIFATAGTSEKREFVRKHGAFKVMHSRDLAFAQATLEATDGEGVDIVLNSLPGEAIAKGMSILKPGGRFLEIGKRDIYADAAIGLEPFRNNLALFAIDLDQWFRQRPAKMGEMLRSLMTRFESGELQPLPATYFSADEIRDAFRFMQQGKHIGKVVVDYSRHPSEVHPGEAMPINFPADATYWIAGGLGGFGSQIATWMIDRGAKNLVLSGRSSTLTPETESMLNQLRSGGANVVVMQCDITDAVDVRRTLQKIDAELPTLRGVFHTAMVLEDRLLVDLDNETLQRVLRPKVIGGWNLHHETLDRPLDHFVLFSSLSSIFGHAGQANYSAANALLDGLTHYRRSLGRPSLVINWGHLGEVGYLAQRQRLGERLQRQGVFPFTVQQAVDCLSHAMQLDLTQLSVLRMDWSLWRGLGITSRVSPRFAHLLKHQTAPEIDAQGRLASADEIRQASPEQRNQMIGDALRLKAGLLLGIDNATLPRDRPLLELGLDSLMAVEMRNWVESQIEISLPISALMRNATLDNLAESVCEIINAGNELSKQSSAAVAPNDESDHGTIPMLGENVDELLRQLPEMADQEVDRLLSQLLRQQGGD